LFQAQFVTCFVSVLFHVSKQLNRANQIH